MGFRQSYETINQRRAFVYNIFRRLALVVRCFGQPYSPLKPALLLLIYSRLPCFTNGKIPNG